MRVLSFWREPRISGRPIESSIMSKVYSVYIMTNKPFGTLYTGVTSDLLKRVWQHKNKVVRGFTTEYNLNRLVYYEMFEDVNEAIKREKQIKNLVRRKKIVLILKMNPEWKDLYEGLIK